VVHLARSVRVQRCPGIQRLGQHQILSRKMGSFSKRSSFRARLPNENASHMLNSPCSAWFLLHYCCLLFFGSRSNSQAFRNICATMSYFGGFWGSVNASPHAQQPQPMLMPHNDASPAHNSAASCFIICILPVIVTLLAIRVSFSQGIARCVVQPSMLAGRY